MKKSLVRLGMGMMLLVAFASCKKLGEMKPEYFAVNPNPLEVKAGKVEGTITATFPEKYFVEKAKVEVTPVLVYAGGEAKAESKTYQGTKVEGNDETVQYKAGGTVTQNFSFDYVPEMAKSTLVLRFNATVKDKAVQIPDVEIAVGCINTCTLANAAEIAPAYAKDQFVRDTKEVTEADIMFDIQKSNVKGNDDVKALNAAVAATKNDERRTVESLQLVSSASPDGGVKLNEGLASARQKNTAAFLKKQKNQAAIDAKYIAQDWEGFQALVAQSNIKDKGLILNVLSAYQDPEQREKEIKNLSEAYTELATDILPKLRRSHMALTVNVAGKTDEELLALAKSNPDSLTVDELMYAAKIASKEDAAAFNAKNAELNAADWRTSNNNAADLFAANDATAASNKLGTAFVNGGSEQAEPNFNMGLIDLVNGNTEAAQQHLGKAAGVEQLGEAQGVMYIQKGEYAKAVDAFGNTTSNNAALAQMLVGNNDKAASILSNVQDKNANTYYLAAICAARGGDAAKTATQLKEAVKLDNSYALRALNDLEFSKMWENADFQAALK